MLFFGALLLCACEKENIDPLVEDQALLEESALKTAELPVVPDGLIEDKVQRAGPFWARMGSGELFGIPTTDEYGIIFFYIKDPAGTIPPDFNLLSFWDSRANDPSVHSSVKGTTWHIPDHPVPPYMTLLEDKIPVPFWIITIDQVHQVIADGIVTIVELEGLSPAPMKGFSKDFTQLLHPGGGGAPVEEIGLDISAFGHLKYGRKFYYSFKSGIVDGDWWQTVAFDILDKKGR